MSANLVQLAELVQRGAGISLKGAQLASLEAALRRIDPTMTSADRLLASPESANRAALLERLIDEVSIKETFFLRQRAEFDAIDWRQLVHDARASGSERARVWVAACATGEEAYTLAILASQAFGQEPPPVSIYATDLSASALGHAQRGRYGRRATRLLDEADIRRYFATEGDELVVGEQLRGMVHFSRQNLVRDPVPAGGGPFDLVACRNVLIYFEREAIERVVAALMSALSPDGTLLLGAADRLCCSAGKLLRMHESARGVAHQWQRPPSAQPFRRPLGREQPNAPPVPPAGATAPVPRIELGAALQAANVGDLQLALDETARVLDRDPLDPNAYFIRGLAHRGLGQADEAVRAFRSALYVDPKFAVAAFEMGRAHEACGDTTAAARAYRQALHVLDPTPPSNHRHAPVDVGDVGTACAIRLRALRTEPAPV